MKKILLILALSSFSVFGQPDLTITSVQNPTDGCNLSSSTNLFITIYNSSPTPYQGTMEVGYELNGGAPVVENYTVSIGPGPVYNFTFPMPVDFSSCQEHELVVWVYDSTDVNHSNDTLTAQIINDCAVAGIFNDSTGCIYYPDSLCHDMYTGIVSDWLYKPYGLSPWFSLGDTTDCIDLFNIGNSTEVQAKIESLFGLCPPDSAITMVNCTISVGENNDKDIKVRTLINDGHPWIISGLSNHAENQVLVYDINGQLIYSQSNYNNDWTAEGIPSGMYLYEIRLEDETFTGKLVVE